MYGGEFAFQNRLGWLVVGRKFTIVALFYFVFEGKFQVQAPRGAYIRRGDLTEGFLRYDLGGLILFWRGLYMEGLIFGILRYVHLFLAKLIYHNDFAKKKKKVLIWGKSELQLIFMFNFFCL